MRVVAGFTLIELLVVLAIVALLLTIATPRYIHHVERAREATLRSTLKVMRASIDKFYGDQGRFPETLDELVARNYLHDVPLDPVTDKRDTWIVLSEAETRTAAAAPAPRGGANTPGPPPQATGVADVHSGAPGNGSDGSAFKDWWQACPREWQRRGRLQGLVAINRCYIAVILSCRHPHRGHYLAPASRSRHKRRLA